MRKTAHISVFVLSLTLALILGVLDHETHTISALFLNKGNIFALVIYTLLFMTVSYTGIWIYKRTKIVLKNKPTD
jgi:hypothetical protein